MSVDENRLRSIKNRVEDNSKSIERIVEAIVSKYNQELTAEVEKIKVMLDNKDTLEDTEIEHLVMRLPVYMYFANNGLETLGVESDMAKAVKSDIFNMKYLQAEGTIKDKEATANQQIVNEQFIEIAFQRAYKKLKGNLDMAEAVFSGAKKVLSRRMIEIDINKRDN